MKFYYYLIHPLCILHNIHSSPFIFFPFKPSFMYICFLFLPSVIHSVTILSSFYHSSSALFLQVLYRGLKRRKIASTRLNCESSRSHSIFTIRVVQVRLSTCLGTDLYVLITISYKKKKAHCVHVFVFCQLLHVPDYLSFTMSPGTP